MKNFNIIRFVALLVVYSINCAYVYYFRDSLYYYSYLDLHNFSFLVLPDTFRYALIMDSFDPIGSIINVQHRNSIVPMSLWYLSGYNWYIVGFYNILIIYLITKYIEKFKALFNLNAKWVNYSIIIFILCPSTIYYSIGATKEPVTALLLIVFVYALVSKKTAQSFGVLVAMAATRIQLLALLPYIFFIKFFNSKIFIKLFILLLLITSLYPLISLGVIDQSAALRYRIEAGNIGTIGYVIEMTRNNYVIVSSFAIFIRTLQCIFEPIIIMIKQPNFVSGGQINIFNLQNFLTFFLIIPYIYLFFLKCFDILRFNFSYSHNIQFIVIFTLSCLIFFAGFYFVSFRFIYPLFPLFIISSLLPKYEYT